MIIELLFLESCSMLIKVTNLSSVDIELILLYDVQLKYSIELFRLFESNKLETTRAAETSVKVAVTNAHGIFELSVTISIN
jgi:hypothetical protein